MRLANQWFVIDRLSIPASGTGPLYDAPDTRGRSVLKMIQGDRTAGSMPVWQRQEENFTPSGETLKLRLNASPPSKTENESTSYSFFDLLDIVNPLQHIPLVSTLYQKITGDEIKPPARIIGGGIFGGFAGAASGIVNAIVERETGHDVAGNAARLVLRGDLPEIKKRGSNDLPGSVIAMADLGARSLDNVPAEFLLWPDNSQKSPWNRQ
jgi:hypothetical protein